MTPSLFIIAAAFAAVAGVQAAPAPCAVTVNTTSASPIPATFAGFGWEMYAMLSFMPHMNDTRFATAARGLAPALLRVGGITADWVRYVGMNGAPPRAVSAHAPLPPHTPALGGYWPTAPVNLTARGDFAALLSFARAANFSLMFTLNELYGRNCNATKPGCPTCDDWCVGKWDTSNVRAFLQYIHDEGLFGAPGALHSFELGNELAWHQYANDTVADIVTLAGIIQEVWADAPATSRPLLYAPSTDDCTDAAQLEIMANITGVAGVGGFTFHGYPGQSGAGAEDLASILLNSTWLRERIMTGSNAVGCLDAWNAGPRARGLELLVTESSSSWAWDLPPPAQNSFIHGFFTVAELGQYATRGVSAVARWALTEGSPFATIAFNASRGPAGGWDAAADYFILAAHKRAVGAAALRSTFDPVSGALVYAACGPARNGSVALSAVNPTLAPVTLTLADAVGAPLAPAPRLAYVFTAPGGPGDLASLTPLLNGGAALRLADDGTPPPIEPVFVGSGAIVLPPRSQAFFVLLDARAPACGA
jgi:hypothetical protein